MNTADKATTLRTTHTLPCCGQKNVGIGCVNGNVNDAGGIVHEEDLTPCCSGIGRLVDAALTVAGEERSHSRNIQNIGIDRINHNLANVPGLFQSEMYP